MSSRTRFHFHSGVILLFPNPFTRVDFGLDSLDSSLTGVTGISARPATNGESTGGDSSSLNTTPQSQ